MFDRAVDMIRERDVHPFSTVCNTNHNFARKWGGCMGNKGRGGNMIMAEFEFGGVTLPPDTTPMCASRVQRTDTFIVHNIM